MKWEWESAKFAPQDKFALVRWGTKANGCCGYDIAQLNKKNGHWYDRFGNCIDDSGYEVIDYVLLPRL